ncbi:MAG: T9SS type A sorting domain-containing protein [Salibacteraceae bacterium]
MEHSILTYANDTSVIFRFTMGSDGSTVNEGVGFDDMIVAESNDIAISDVIYPDSICGESATEIQAVLCNISIEDKSGFSVLVDTNGSSLTYNYPDTLPVCACDTVTVVSINTSNGGFWEFNLEVDNNGDVNASNDTASGDILTYSIPGGEIVSGEGEYCEGEAVQLTFELTGTGPWNMSYSNGVSGSNANQISSPYTTIVSEGGSYQIISLTDSTGCAGDTGTFGGIEEVIMHPNPTPNLGPDTTICGDYELDAGSGVFYTWNTGETTQTLDIYAPGNYAVTVEDANGCVGFDDVDLIVNPLPVITIKDTVLCDGGTFTFNAGGPFQSYLWDDGSTSQIRVVNGITSVSVTVTDFNECTNDKTASILEIVDNPQPNITVYEGVAPITLDAGAGYLGYYWNTGQTTQTIQVGAVSTYTCTVTDYNGCKGSDNAKSVIWPNSIEDVIELEGVAVYPNPANNYFEIGFGKTQAIPTSVELIDIKGSKVAEFGLDNGSDRSRISLPSNIGSGSYFVRVKIDDGLKDLPLIIQK